MLFQLHKFVKMYRLKARGKKAKIKSNQFTLRNVQCTKCAFYTKINDQTLYAS